MRATRFAPMMRWWPSIASSMPGALPPAAHLATIHLDGTAHEKSLFYRARRSYCEAPVSACARSESSGSMAETSRTAISPPIGPEHRRAGAAWLMCLT